jgi:hypothetical protein
MDARDWDGQVSWASDITNTPLSEYFSRFLPYARSYEVFEFRIAPPSRGQLPQ